MNVTHPVSRIHGSGPAERLDGWKSIAAYLKRDRTTVIRWTRERGLPVHRLPGGRTGTVYALKHELDRWVGLPDAPSDMPSDQTPAAKSAAASGIPTDQPLLAGQFPGRRWLFAVAAAGLAIGIPSLIAPSLISTRGAAVADPRVAVALPLELPANTATSAKFLEARDLVADRKAEGLERAISLLQEVVRTAPDYAPGHAALAEALLLSREFGVRSDAEAFEQARVAARAAVRLAPDRAEGHRMLGFIAYWADRDFAEADALFRQALALDPGDAWSHFWYGNILSDHGEHAAGLKALTQARLLQPGSVAIATDLAWARWATGQDEMAKAALDAIIREHPDFAVAYDCRAIIALSEGDYRGYSENFARFAALKMDDKLIADASAVRDAISRGDDEGRREIMRQALAGFTKDGMRNAAWPALVASAAGDRGELRKILLATKRRTAQQQDAGVWLHIARAWQHDPEIAALSRRSAKTG